MRHATKLRSITLPETWPAREKNNRQAYRDAGGFTSNQDRRCERRENLNRYIGTTTVSKHRLFGWFESPVMPDHQLIIFARSDDLFFGLLHSRSHEIWLRLGTKFAKVESGFRYTPSSCFETFPFPQPTADQEAAIAAAAKELDELRVTVAEPAGVDADGGFGVSRLAGRAVGAVRRGRRRPRHRHRSLAVPGAKTPMRRQPQERTLTNLYNQRPAWLDL